MDDLGPVGRVVAPFLFIAGPGHRGDHEAGLGVRLVLALAVEVEKYRAVGVEDRLHTDALILVFLVLLVLVDGAQAPGAKAAAHCFLKGVVVGLVGHAVLLVGTVQAVAGLGQLVVLAILADVVHRDAVVAVFVDDADHRQHDLIDLELGLVLVLVPEWAFPLRTAKAVEAPVLQALQALVAQGSLNVIKLL